MAGDELDERLLRFRKMPKAVRLVYARPRTFFAVALGIVAFLLLPSSLRLVTRLLIGWDSFVAVYIVLVTIMMGRSNLNTIRRMAALQDDGRFLIPLLTALGAFASLAAIVFELGQANHKPAELMFAILTVTLSWAAVHAGFALHYAHEYYRGSKPGGLQFPSGDKNEHRDHPRNHLVRVQHRAAGADGQYRRERALKHDPEKCEAVFPRDKRGTRLSGDHASSNN
jgi:uncharacterized membrane protein